MSLDEPRCENQIGTLEVVLDSISPAAHKLHNGRRVERFSVFPQHRKVSRGGDRADSSRLQRTFFFTNGHAALFGLLPHDELEVMVDWRRGVGP